MSRLKNARTSHLQRHVVPAATTLLLDRASQLTDTFRPLADICHIEMGQSPIGSAYNTNGDGLGLIGGPADLGLIYPAPKKWTTQPTKICEAGDIIICVRATIGEPRWSDGEYCLGRGVAGIRPLSKDLNPSFVFRLLQAREEELRAQGTGTTFKTISKIHLERLQLPTLTPKHQELIANFLDWLDNSEPDSISMGNAPELPHEYAEQERIIARIEAIARRVEEARGLRQKAAEEAKSVISSETNRIFAQLNHHQMIRLGTLGTNNSNPIQTGPFGAQLHTYDFVETGIPVLNVGNVWPEGIDLSHIDYVIPEKAQTLSRYSLQENDLLFARTGATLGKVCIVPKGCDGWLMTGHLFRVRFDMKRCDPRYVFVALRGADTVRSQVFAQVRGATRPGFNTGLLSNVRLPVPPLSEQQRIVAYLDGLQAKVDELKRLQAKTQKELDALMPSVLAKAFAGEF